MNQVAAGWKQRIPWLLSAAVLFHSAAWMFRMLWFDEVLTTDLLMRLPLGRIYFAYDIPNNHIIFTLLEKIWFLVVRSLTGFSYFYFRLVPMLLAAAAVYLLSKKLLRCAGMIAGTAIPFFFGISTVFGMYATAVRGYMLGFLLTVLAMFCAEKLLRCGRWKDGLWYFILSLLAVGTAPTNLAALAGTALFWFSFAWRRKQLKRWSLLIGFPILALIVFYLPILPKFIGCIRLGEGWHSASHALYAVMTGSLFPFSGLLLFLVFGAGILWKKYPRLRLHCLIGFLILCLPALAYAVMKVPPFPRVFFPLSAVWLFLFAHLLNAYLHQVRGKRFWILLPLVLQTVLTLAFFQERSVVVSNFLYGNSGTMDDFIAPYYARLDFVPNKVIAYLKGKLESDGELHAFATFSADSPSLLCAAGLAELPEDVLLMDRLNRPKTLRLQDYPGAKYIIASDSGDLENTRKRFGFTRAVLKKSFGRQQIYRVE